MFVNVTVFTVKTMPAQAKKKSFGSPELDL